MKYKVGNKVRVSHEVMGETKGVVFEILDDDTRWPYRVDTGETLFLYTEEDSPDLVFHDYIIGKADD